MLRALTVGLLAAWAAACSDVRFVARWPADGPDTPSDAPAPSDAPDGAAADGPGDAARDSALDVGSSDTADAPPPGALVGHWKLDDGTGANAADSSGRANNGTLIGYVTPDWRPGRIGTGALGFDGATQWVRVPSSPSIDTVHTGNRFSVAAWVYLLEPTRPGNTVVSRQDGDTEAEHFALRFSAGGRPTLIVNSYALGETVSCSDIDGASADTWLHMAGTFDGATAILYTRGREACRFSHAHAIEPDANPIVIGGNNNGAAVARDLLQGMIDDVAIYNRVLSRGEIAAIAAGGPPPP